MGDRSQVAIVKTPRRSDATFWRDGTVTDHAYWGEWQARLWKRAGWKKAVIKLAVVAVLAGTGWGWLFHRNGTERVSAVVCGLVLGAVTVRGLLALEHRAHFRSRVRPLHYALGPMLGIEAKPQAWLDVPLDYASNEDAEVVIYSPKAFTGRDGERADLERAVTSRLPELENPDFKYLLDGLRPRIVVTHSPPPPGKVTWAGIEAAVAAAGDDELVFGIGRRDTVVAASLQGDSPHVGYQGGSGWGKTNTASLVALQFLHRGDNCCFIDGKLISYPWARGLRNVAYGGTIAEIHDLLVWFGGELRRRNEVALAGLQPSGFIHANVGHRWHIFAEELNYVIPQLKDYWADLRALDKDLPKRSPALAALAAMAFAGRQAKLHEHFIAQLITAAATGANDTSVRGNIGIAAMARYRLAGWQKMTDLPMPPCPDTPGRIQVVTAGGFRETQVPYLHLDDDNEKVAAAAAEWARDYATSGVCSPLPAGMPGATFVPGAPQLTHAGAEQPFVVGHDDPVLAAGAGPVAAVTLAEAVAAGLFASKAAARKAAQRRSWEPVVEDPVGGHRYAIADLAAYKQSRGK